MKKAILVAVPVLLVLGLIGYSIWRQLSKQTVEHPSSIAVPVVVITPRRGSISRVLSYAGTLEPKAMVTVTPKVPGRIERIDVREGDWVAKGEIVAEMDDEVVRLQMEQAGNAYRAAEAQYEKARKGVRSGELANAEALLAQAEKDVAAAEESYERLGKLYKEGTISRTRYEDADRQVSSARTQLENARRSVQMMQQGASTEELSMAESQMKAMQSQYELAKLGLDNARIASPLPGRVVKVHTDQGNMAGQSTPLVTIVQEDPMLVRIPVPEKHYGDLTERLASLSARVRLNALPDKEYRGRVSALSPTIDPASRTFTVEVELSNGGGLLHAGMYARVELVVERIPDALLLPAAAVVTRAGKTGVFTVRQGNSQVARFTTVVIGLAEGELVQIVQGLAETDRVISEGNTFLEEGETVAPAP